MSTRQRADRLLVDRGLFESRARAQAAIAAGLVTANGEVVKKPSDTIAADAVLSAQAAHPWVSRGGVKLAHALDFFGITAADRVCLDVGASTGGFTHVLLEQGARMVHAVDVGHDQLHASLQGDTRVASREKCDIRDLPPLALVPLPDLAVIDVSFISLKHVLPATLAQCAARCNIIALIKPQFEAERAAIRKGIVRDAETHQRVCDETAAMFEGFGCTIMGVTESPITGGDGNREFLIGARHG